MQDEKAWRIAISQFNALRSNIPSSVSEDVVSEYHNILETLQSASGEDLSSFRVPQDQIEPRVASFRMGSRRGPGGSTYTRQKYCDTDFFTRKVTALSSYLSTLENSSQTTGDKVVDYWKLTNIQLEELATKYNIGGYAYQNGGIDRTVIIRELLRRDRALELTRPSIADHSIHVGGNMTGSVIQHGTNRSHATVNFNAGEVHETVEQIKAALDDLPLSTEARAELESDIQTIEPQLSSSRPKLAIVSECLRSMRTILEELTAHTGAVLLVHELGKHIANLAH